MRYFLLVFFFFMAATIGLIAQNENMENPNPPYEEIPAAPDKYSTGAVVARMIDGLGYRYYWATEGLTEQDLNYRPSPDGRTAAETLDHLYGLSNTIANTAKGVPNIRRTAKEELTFEEKRKKTLKNFKQSADLLRSTKKKDLKNLNIVFQRGENKSEFPFWNLINGPIADAIYHTGQIVSYRRSSGNPMNPKVNVFRGKNRE